MRIQRVMQLQESTPKFALKYEIWKKMMSKKLSMCNLARQSNVAIEKIMSLTGGDDVPSQQDVERICRVLQVDTSKIYQPQIWVSQEYLHFINN